jgi:CRP-like cAMP-binding protein
MSLHPFQNFTIRFRPGETIFNEGEEGGTMFIVQAGRVLLFRQAQGAKRPLGTLEKGDFFGEMSILEGLPRTHSAEALEDTELIEINSMIFDKMIRGNIEIAVRMLRKLSIRLREAERRIADPLGGGARAAVPPAPAPAAALRPAAAAGAGARLEAEDGSVTFALSGGEALIGRYDPVTELKPDIDLTELDLKRTVSRRHARIVLTERGHMVIEEVGALNGTFVNGAKLVAGQGHAISNGDRLGIGTVSMVFRT